MILTPADWHARYLQQARWTQDLRNYLFERAGIVSAQRVLEVGCGTGVLLSELPDRTQALICGLDLSPSYVQIAAENAPEASLSQADGHSIPFPNGVFDLTFCHFLLLWVSNPEQVVAEMARVTRPGGSVIALAEPDYGGRIDYPEALVVLGKRQEESLKKQGADPKMGRRLAEVFHKSGLQDVVAGVLGGQWRGKLSRQEWEMEWEVLQSDLGIREGLAGLRALDWASRQRGERVLFVPTFYAYGKVGTPTSICPSTTRTG
jgi:ubiquinone/menaquinone biosynthesis C-methylase UbiE